MFSICFLITLLSVLLFFCIYSFSRLILTPQFGILFSFLLSLFGCLIKAEEWGIDFSNLTLIVVTLGIFTIVFVSIIFQNIFEFNRHVTYIFNKNKVKEIDIKKERLIIWSLIQVFNLILVIDFLMEQTGALTLQNAINTYRNSIYLAGNAVPLPFFTRITRSMCIYSGYLFLYLLFYNIVNHIKSKLNKYYVLNIFCAIFTSLIIGGSRGSLLQYVVAGITIFFILYTFKYNRAFSAKQVFGVLGVAIVFLLLFGQMSKWLGRGEVENLGETIFTYLSGGMVNLDSYLQKSTFYQTGKNYTFTELINFYYRFTNQSYLQYRGLLADTYMYRNGVLIGNVYTMFSSYYHDASIVGVILYSGFMAFIGQILLKLVLQNYEPGIINIPMVIYGYIFFNYIQSNFSNRFYSQFFTDNMLKFIFFLIIFKFFLTTNKFRLRSKK